ncbi:MAG: DUF6484 domain-containing protein [Myxococcales bacterium]
MLKSSKRSQPARRTRVPKEVRGHLLGSLIGVREGAPLVTYPDNPHGPLMAKSTLALPSVSDDAVASPVPVLLVFEEERSDRPIVVGLVEARPMAGPSATPSESIEAKLDGKRVVLEAKDEIELRCGKASIVLRRNGRVVIRGTYVETRSEGVNRIKGGSVQIN